MVQCVVELKVQVTGVLGFVYCEASRAVCVFGHMSMSVSLIASVSVNVSVSSL